MHRQRQAWHKGQRRSTKASLRYLNQETDIHQSLNNQPHRKSLLHLQTEPQHINKHYVSCNEGRSFTKSTSYDFHPTCIKAYCQYATESTSYDFHSMCTKAYCQYATEPSSHGFHPRCVKAYWKRATESKSQGLHPWCMRVYTHNFTGSSSRSVRTRTSTRCSTPSRSRPSTYQ